MSFSDETLMAYADGELDEATRRAVEAAMRADAGIARRVARHKARRTTSYATESARRPATVVHLDAVRASRIATQQAARKAGRVRRWSWQEWGALVLALVLGAAIGKFGLASWPAELAGASLVASGSGGMEARGRLDVALDEQLAGASAGGSVRIVGSFVAVDGNYCRSFVAGPQEMAGLACRLGGVWRVPVMVQYVRAAQQLAIRPDGMDVPDAVAAAVDLRIVGTMLDARAEQEAVRHHWKR